MAETGHSKHKNLPSKLMSLDRKYDGYGGVLLATQSNLICHEIQLANSSEAVTIQIQMEKKEHFTVSSLYHPPSVTCDNRMSDLIKALDSAQPGKTMLSRLKEI